MKNAERIIQFPTTLTPGAAVNGAVEAQQGLRRVLLALMFTDIVDSTRVAERLGDDAWRTLLVRHHALVRAQIIAHRGREVDHAGDGFFAVFESPGLALRCADQIRGEVAAIGLRIRAGVHAGECHEADGEVSGVAVHVAARVMAAAAAGEVLASATARDLVAGSPLRFGEGRLRKLRGLSEPRELFALSGAGAATGSSPADAPTRVAVRPLCRARRSRRQPRRAGCRPFGAASSGVRACRRLRVAATKPRCPA